MFGSSAFSAAPFASGAEGVANASVSVTGVSAPVSVNSVSFDAAANAYPTGVQGATALGDVTPKADANVSVSGNQGTSALEIGRAHV